MSTQQHDPIELLREYRHLLLAAEAIGWAHMIDKADPKFLRGHSGHEGVYTQPSWNQQFPDLTQLCWMRRAWLELNRYAWPPEDADFLSKSSKRRGKGSLLVLLQASHGMVSGIEKNYPGEKYVKYLRQDTTHLWRTSPFGLHERNLLSDPPDVLQPGGLEALCSEFSRVFRGLKELFALRSDRGEGLDRVDWSEWRSRAIGEDGLIRRGFMETLAETRVPNNDLTLWDQSYMTAALYKSAVAHLILGFPKDYRFDPDKLRGSTRWRILAVGIGTQHYESRAVRIGDWTGARSSIDQFFDKVRTYIEEDLALGSLIYRDDESLAFTYPGEFYEAAIQSGQGDEGGIKDYSQVLERAIREEITRFAECHDLETPPIIRLSESTRSLIPMARTLRKVRGDLQIPYHLTDGVGYALRREDETGHTCPVCMVRTNGSIPDKQMPCGVCRNRREARLKAWLRGPASGINGDTIWISEVADHNDRVALITMSIGLDPWLDGEFLDSLRTQSIDEWSKHNPSLYKPRDNPVYSSANLPFDSLVEEIKDRIPPNNDAPISKDDRLMNALQQGFQHEHKWPTFFQKVVEDRSQAPTWGALDAEGRAGWLAHQLFRKYAAPGRIYRFWRTTEDFFARLLIETRQIATRSENRWRTRRLVIVPKDPGGLQGHKTYHGLVNGAPFGVVFDGDEGQLITIANLARSLKPTDSGSLLQCREIELTEDDSGRSKTGKIKIKSTISDEPKHLGSYHPVIPLEVSPRRFRVLVPLDVADIVVDTAREWWEREFSRVWDRTPIHIGVIAFTRMTPFQAVVEAARNLESDLSSDGQEWWHVVEGVERGGINTTTFTREDGEPERVAMPVTLADGRADVFYPYLEVSDSKVHFSRDFARPSLLGQGGLRVYRHISDLRRGDRVRVQPSRICKSFLEDTAARFEDNEVQYLSDERSGAEIWELVSGAEISSTALIGAYQAIRRKYDEWGVDIEGATSRSTRAWLEFVRAVLHNELGVRGPALNRLVDAARTGVLLRSLYWHINVLKSNLEGADAEE